MKAKITKRSVEALRPAKRENFIWDTDLSGFGCKITPTGRRVYVLQTRINGRVRRITIGPHGPIAAEQARSHALQLLAEVAAGKDPASARRALRGAPTVQELAERYLAQHAEPRKKPDSVRADRRNLERYILPTIGAFRVDQVGRDDVARLHHQLRETPYAANRVLALLSKMFNLAERWRLRPDFSNPCRHVEKYPEKKRERYLTPSEFSRLGGVLAAAEHTQTESPAVIAAIRLLAFTGARMNEILQLRWEYVDLENKCLRLPDSKTGAKVINLGVPAIVVLESLPRSSPWVIPGRRSDRHLVNLEQPWQRIRARAGLTDVRIHDLRHSYASIATGQNKSLTIIGKLLGHTQAETTQRYAHVADDPMQQAADDVADEIAEHMSAGQHGLRVVK